MAGDGRRGRRYRSDGQHPRGHGDRCGIRSILRSCARRGDRRDVRRHARTPRIRRALGCSRAGCSRSHRARGGHGDGDRGAAVGSLGASGVGARPRLPGHGRVGDRGAGGAADDHHCLHGDSSDHLPRHRRLPRRGAQPERAHDPGVAAGSGRLADRPRWRPAHPDPGNARALRGRQAHAGRGRVRSGVGRFTRACRAARARRCAWSRRHACRRRPGPRRGSPSRVPAGRRGGAAGAFPARSRCGVMGRVCGMARARSRDRRLASGGDRGRALGGHFS